jgi:hypothetical protein
MDSSNTLHDCSGNILDGFVPRQVFADANGTTVRTIDRYRAEGLPWLRWSGVIFIGPIPEARTWLKARVRRTTGGTPS